MISGGAAGRGRAYPHGDGLLDRRHARGRPAGPSRRQRRQSDPQAAAAAMEANLGPQKITIHGVPETSHFAHVMVAADYRMKRVSLALEPSPVAGLPSFVDLAKPGRGLQHALPRWWLEPTYEPPVRDAQGLAWELRGAKVKTMTETDFFDANGIARPTGKADPVAQRWADIMTERYEALSKVEPVFGQLRTCMDLAVVAALLVKENLPAKAGNRLPHLTGKGSLQTAKLLAPKQVPCQALAVQKGRTWMIAAGGVQINPWAVVEKAKNQRRGDRHPQVVRRQAGQLVVGLRRGTGDWGRVAGVPGTRRSAVSYQPPAG